MCAWYETQFWFICVFLPTHKGQCVWSLVRHKISFSFGYIERIIFLQMRCRNIIYTWKSKPRIDRWTHQFSNINNYSLSINTATLALCLLQIKRSNKVNIEQHIAFYLDLIHYIAKRFENFLPGWLNVFNLLLHNDISAASELLPFKRLLCVFCACVYNLR